MRIPLHHPGRHANNVRRLQHVPTLLFQRQACAAQSEKNRRHKDQCAKHRHRTRHEITGPKQRKRVALQHSSNQEQHLAKTAEQTAEDHTQGHGKRHADRLFGQEPIEEAGEKGIASQLKNHAKRT